MADYSEMQGMSIGLARLRSWLRRDLRRAPAFDGTTAVEETRDRLLPGESAAAWITTHSELGEMTGVAIEMLDLSRRWRRRSD